MTILERVAWVRRVRGPSEVWRSLVASRGWCGVLRRTDSGRHRGDPGPCRRGRTPTRTGHLAARRTPHATRSADRQPTAARLPAVVTPTPTDGRPASRIPCDALVHSVLEAPACTIDSGSVPSWTQASHTENPWSPSCDGAAAAQAAPRPVNTTRMVRRQISTS